eukprot:scpid34027/ scgid12624/ 
MAWPGSFGTITAYLQVQCAIFILHSTFAWHPALAAADDDVYQDPTFLVSIILGAMTLGILVALVIIVIKYRSLRRQYDELKESPVPGQCPHCAPRPLSAAVRQRSQSAECVDRTGLELRNYEESAYAVCRTRQVQPVPRFNNPSLAITAQPHNVHHHSAMMRPVASHPATASVGAVNRQYPAPPPSYAREQKMPYPKDGSQKTAMSLQTSPIMKRRFLGSLMKRQSSLPLLEVASDAMLNEMYPPSGNSSMGSNGEEVRQRMMQLGAPPSLDGSSSSASIRTQIRQRAAQLGPAVAGMEQGATATTHTTTDFPMEPGQDRFLQDMTTARRTEHGANLVLTSSLAQAATQPVVSSVRAHSRTPPPASTAVPYMYRESIDVNGYLSKARSMENLPYTGPMAPSPSNRNGRSISASSPTRCVSPPSNSMTSQQMGGAAAQDAPFFIAQSRQFPSVLHSLEEEPRQSASDLILAQHPSGQARSLLPLSNMSYASSAGGRTADTASTGICSSPDLGISTDAGFSTEDQAPNRPASRDISQKRKKRSARRRSQDGLNGPIAQFAAGRPSNQRVALLRNHARSPGTPGGTDGGGSGSGVDAVFGAGPRSAPLLHTDFSDSDIPHFSSAAASVISTYDVPQTPAVPATTLRARFGDVHVYDTPSDPVPTRNTVVAASGSPAHMQHNATDTAAGKVTFNIPGVQIRDRGAAVKAAGGAAAEDAVFLRGAHHAYQHSSLSSAQSSFQFTPGTCEVKLGS